MRPKTSRSPALNSSRSPALIWSEIAAVMGPGLLAAIACAVWIQDQFGPGIGNRWNINLGQAVIFVGIMLVALVIGMAVGVLLWALAARIFLPADQIRRELTQPALPLVSWYGRKVADLVVGKYR